MNACGSPTVAKVLAGNLCSGCGLCAGLTQTAMVVEQPGFNRPRISAPVPAETEAAIAGSCPGVVVAPWGPASHRHHYWGPYLALRTGHATNERLRHRSSSGGALSALLGHALETNIVDAIVEVMADPSRPTWNIVTVATSADEILAGAGSRYAPSSPLESILQLLERKDRLAFVGKPCDVSALRLLGRHDARVAERFPLILSFFCAGIPSLQRSDAVVRKMGLDPAELESFRYRGEGWPGHAAGKSLNGDEKRMTYADSWGGVLSKEIQFRCKICPDAVGGSADLVCADAWHCDASGYPVFEDLPGRSLIIPRTPAGADLLRGAVEARAVRLDPEKLSDDDIGRMQPGQTGKKSLVSARTAALRLLLRPVPIMEGLSVREASKRASAGLRLRNFVGMIRRVLRGKM